VLCAANFVHRRHGWIRLRNITTGLEWNENGLGSWKTSQMAALEWAICSAGSCLDPIPRIWGRDHNRELPLKRLIKLCVLADDIMTGKKKFKSGHKVDWTNDD
jgi:hypothetical protein